MLQRNNQLVVCAGLILAFVCAIPVKWYTLKNVGFTGDMSVTGISGIISLWFDTPIWLLLAVSTFFTVVAVTNILKITSIPGYVLAVGLILPGIDYVQPFFVPAQSLSIAVGPVLAVTATLVALALVFAEATVSRPERAPSAATPINVWK